MLRVSRDVTGQGQRHHRAFWARRFWGEGHGIAGSWSVERVRGGHGADLRGSGPDPQGGGRGVVEAAVDGLDAPPADGVRPVALQTDKRTGHGMHTDRPGGVQVCDRGGGVRDPWESPSCLTHPNMKEPCLINSSGLQRCGIVDGHALRILLHQHSQVWGAAYFMRRRKGWMAQAHQKAWRPCTTLPTPPKFRCADFLKDEIPPSPRRRRSERIRTYLSGTSVPCQHGAFSHFFRLFSTFGLIHQNVVT